MDFVQPNQGNSLRANKFASPEQLCAPTILAYFAPAAMFSIGQTCLFHKAERESKVRMLRLAFRINFKQLFDMVEL